MNKAIKRNKRRYKETGMYLRMLDRRMQPIKEALLLDAYMRTFDCTNGKDVVFVSGHMGSFHIQRVLKDD